MSKSRARLRTQVTGEAHNQAARWIAENGVARGLVPDALASEQALLEAAVLSALARPTMWPVLRPEGTLYGITRAAPGVESLTLWFESAHTAAVLARVLPAGGEEGVAGVPGLRASVGATRIRLARPGEWPGIEVHARRRDLRAAEQLQHEAGLTALGRTKRVTVEEAQAWHRLTRALQESCAGFSRALRRPAVFLAHHPDWRTTAPSLADAAGPEALQRFDPRLASPVVPGRAPVVSVRGDGMEGLGICTVAAGLAGAMAGRGHRTALLLDPVLAGYLLPHHPPVPPGQWQQVAEVSEGRLEVAGLLPGSNAGLLAEAKRRAEVVVIDTSGAVSNLGELLEGADLFVTLASDRISADKISAARWGGTGRFDEWPERVQLLSWLTDGFRSYIASWKDEQAMLEELDRRFIPYVQARAAGERPTVYEGSRARLGVESWFWKPAPLPPDGEELLPDEDSQPLDEWRTDFLDLAAQEGARRFGARWPSMSSTWRKSNRLRPPDRLSPLDPTPDVADTLRAAFLKDIADRARRTWGPLWDEHRDAWAAAAAAQEDLTSAWDSRLGSRTGELGAEAITEALLSAIPRSPRRPGRELLVLNKPPLPRERVAAVAAALAESGVAGLVQVPRSVAIQEDPSSLLLGADNVTVRALEELAGTALELLPEATPGTRD